MFKKLLALVGVAAIVLGWAAPAFAHEEISPTSVPTGRPSFFTLTAANEEKVDLVKLVVTAPPNLPFGATTREPSGWTSDVSDKVITYTGPGVKPDKFDQWGFEIDSADQPGTYTYKITLGFADGKTDDVSVPITATANGTTGSGGGATTATTPTTAASTTTAATSSPATVPASVTKSISSTKDKATTASTLAVVGVILGGVALVLAIAALVRRKATPAAGPAPAPTARPQDF